MDRTRFYAVFEDVFYQNGLETYIKGEIIEKFAALTDIMLETNAVMNITALTTIEKIIPLHYADSVLAAAHIPTGSRVVDIGCGGGFPILPLAIVRPDLNLLGVDSTEKKVRYVQSTAKKLGLSHVEALSSRAEDLGNDKQFRDSFDVVISRAVARLHILNELCLPLIRVNGLFLAMKGAAGAEERDEAMHGCHILGGKIDQYIEYDLHTQDNIEKRSLICVNKTTPTPPLYPRSFGAIKKKPL